MVTAWCLLFPCNPYFQNHILFTLSCSETGIAIALVNRAASCWVLSESFASPLNWSMNSSGQFVALGVITLRSVGQLLRGLSETRSSARRLRHLSLVRGEDNCPWSWLCYELRLCFCSRPEVITILQHCRVFATARLSGSHQEHSCSATRTLRRFPWSNCPYINSM